MTLFIEVSLNHFKKIYPIGKGGFGRVWKIKARKDHFDSDSNGYYALKEMSKVLIYIKRSIQPILNERKFLEILNHPFLSNMHYAFETKENVCIIMDYFSGGDLRYHICKRPHFTEKEVKFITANILIALQYIHANHIIHRDLKPENLVFDNKGYLHLTDFGIAHEYYVGDLIMDSSGTPGYMSPEVMVKLPHNFAVDFYSLGVIIHELMTGKRPYSGTSRKDLKEQMAVKEAKLKYSNLPKKWKDGSVIDLVNGLLKRKWNERLGARGVEEVMRHPWLKDIDWTTIKLQKATSPFVFHSEDNFDEGYANKKIESKYEENKEYYLSVINASKYFKFFYYDERYANRDSSTGRSKNCTSSSSNKNLVLKKLPTYKLKEKNIRNPSVKELFSTRSISPFLPPIERKKISLQDDEGETSNIEPLSVKISRRSSHSSRLN